MKLLFFKESHFYKGQAVWLCLFPMLNLFFFLVELYFTSDIFLTILFSSSLALLYPKMFDRCLGGKYLDDSISGDFPPNLVSNYDGFTISSKRRLVFLLVTITLAFEI